MYYFYIEYYRLIFEKVYRILAVLTRKNLAFLVTYSFIH